MGGLTLAPGRPRGEARSRPCACGTPRGRNDDLWPARHEPEG